MGVIGTILLVAFVIVCVLLVLLVLVQNEDSNGMGSAFGGGQSAAFGSHSASVLTKTTGVLVALFFVLAFSMAFVNRQKGSASALGEAAKEVSGSEETAVEATAEAGSWLDDETDGTQGDVTVESAAPAETAVPAAE